MIATSCASACSGRTSTRGWSISWLRRPRWGVRRWATVVVLVVVIITATPAKASAQERTPNPNSTFDAAAYDETLRRCGAEGITGGCGDTPDTDHTLMASAFGRDDIGRAGIPSSHYDIGYSDSAFGVGDKIFAGLTSLPFSFGKMIVAGTVNVLRWAFGFKVGQAMAAPTQSAASDFHSGLQGDSRSPNIYALTFFIATVVCGVWALRGRGSKALGEMIVTYGLYVAFLAFVALTPNGFSSLMTNALAGAGQTSGMIGAIALRTVGDTETCPSVIGPGPGDAPQLENAACPFGRALHAALVEKPYDLINWGTDLGSGGDPGNPLRVCAQARDRILFAGPHGAADEPRDIMNDAGEPCKPLAKFNASASADRAALAASNVPVALLVAFFVITVTVVLMAIQLLFSLTIMLTPFAVAIGLVPEVGRSVFWRWATYALKALVTVVGIAVALCFYLVALVVVMGLTAGQPWFMQITAMMVPQVALVIAMFVVTYKSVKASRRGAEAVTQRASHARVGGGHSSFVAGAAAGWGAASLHDHDIRYARLQARRARHHAASVYHRTRHPIAGRGGARTPTAVAGGVVRRGGQHGGRGEPSRRPGFGSRVTKYDFGAPNKDGSPRQPVITTTTGRANQRPDRHAGGGQRPRRTTGRPAPARRRPAPGAGAARARPSATKKAEVKKRASAPRTGSGAAARNPRGGGRPTPASTSGASKRSTAAESSGRAPAKGARAGVSQPRVERPPSRTPSLRAPSGGQGAATGRPGAGTTRRRPATGPGAGTPPAARRRPGPPRMGDPAAPPPPPKPPWRPKPD
jgi:hypothetical protein